MDLTELCRKARKRRPRKRRGRGQGSGIGGTSGRGNKGAKARSGWKARYAYEGGQMPLIRRMPKIGFTNAVFRKRYDVINLDALEANFDAGSTVELATLEERHILNARNKRLKVLGSGDLQKSLTVVAHAVSASARRKIEAAGGKVQLLGGAEGKKEK